MPTLKTKLILGTKPQPETLRKLQQDAGMRPNLALNFLVFQIDYDRKRCYGCWSGGELRDGEPYLTPVGQAAMEALANLPIGDSNRFIFQELKLGPTPLRDKIKATLRRAPADSKICFFGDMQGELDGRLHQAFNVVKGSLNIAH